MLLPSLAFAAYNNITYSTSATVSLTGLNTTLTINSGANINNIAVGANSITLILERDANGVSTIKLTPASGYILNSSGASSDSSGCGTPPLALSGPGSVGTSTVTVTPQSCTSGPGGSGASSSASTSTSTPNTTSAPAGSGSTATPAPIATPTPTPTPAPAPAPTVSAGPVMIPSLSAKPSNDELASVITAVTNQIVYIQANLKAPNILSILQDTMSKLVQVQNALSAPAAPVSSSAPLKKPLSVGSKGADVTALQNFLKSQGSQVYPGGNVTGYFGKATESALGRFQLKYGLIKSAKDVGYGYLGPKTREKINSLLRP